MKKRMSTSNRVRVLCVAAIVLFGLLSAVLTDYQKEAKAEWFRFLDSFGVEKDLQHRYGCLTREEMASVDSKLGERNLGTRDALWRRYGYYDYWLSISRSLVALAVVVVIVTYLRTLLDRIPVPERLYRKLYLPPQGMEVGGREEDGTQTSKVDT